MENRNDTTDTIFAIATPPGVGGVGVIRISGPQAPSIIEQLTGALPAPRHAALQRFLAKDGNAIDSGITLYFPAPNSFTGEHVVEIQGHGGPVVQQLLSQRVMSLGARAARPGEFSERAFLNDKLDLAQAEAIADLVESGTAAAARAAQRSLEGVFSRQVNSLLEELTSLRVFIEAALDFPDEEIDFIAESDVEERVAAAIDRTDELLDGAQQGRLLRDGITVAIVGAPNAGKSSLLNALSGYDSAIVTDIPGTTRDVLRESISLDGVPVHIADTAGIREATDRIEAEGVRRARAALEKADLVVLVRDLANPGPGADSLLQGLGEGVPVITAWNKLDITPEPFPDDESSVVISAKTGQGVAELKKMILLQAGCQAHPEGSFSARARHLDALTRTRAGLQSAAGQLQAGNAAELVAEELRLAQRALGEITGVFLPDDLLGAIFASFCIGK